MSAESGLDTPVALLARPSWIELVATASTVVDNIPDASVTTNVNAVGGGVISGIALALITAVGAPAKIGLYVLAPNSDETS